MPCRAAPSLERGGRGPIGRRGRGRGTERHEAPAQPAGPAPGPANCSQVQPTMHAASNICLHSHKGRYYAKIFMYGYVSPAYICKCVHDRRACMAPVMHSSPHSFPVGPWKGLTPSRPCRTREGPWSGGGDGPHIYNTPSHSNLFRSTAPQPPRQTPRLKLTDGVFLHMLPTRWTSRWTSMVTSPWGSTWGPPPIVPGPPWEPPR